MADISQINLPTNGGSTTYDIRDRKSFWEGTQEEYDSIPIKDPNTTYYIKDSASYSVSADNVTYNNGSSGLSANTVQNAIDELNTDIAKKQNNLSGGSISNKDLNTLTDTMTYWVTTTGMSNTPTNSFGYLEVFKQADTVYFQRFIEYGTFVVWERYHVNNQWYAWKRISRPITINEHTIQLGTTLWSGVYYGEKDISSDITNYGAVIGLVVIGESEFSTFASETNRPTYAQLISNATKIRVYSPQASTASGHYVKVRVTHSK